MYNPEPIAPNDDLRRYLAGELEKLAGVFQGFTIGFPLTELTAPPKKYRDGLIVFADGTLWNPGSGRGFYGYSSGAWRFLG